MPWNNFSKIEPNMKMLHSSLFLEIYFTKLKQTLPNKIKYIIKTSIFIFYKTTKISTYYLN